jgi:starch synthase
VGAPPVGGIPRLVENGRTGFLVNPGDSAALADRLAWIIDDPDTAARLGEAGRQEAVRYHTWGRQADRTNSLFESVLYDRGLFTDASPLQKAG